MRKRKDIEFESFRDGIVYLHDLTDDGKLGKQIAKLRFSNRTVSEGAYAESLQLDIQISRKIRVKMFQRIDEDTKDYFRAKIGDQVYKISRVQHYRNNIPAVSDLTLSAERRRK